jgi:hypothetical protein
MANDPFTARRHAKPAAPLRLARESSAAPTTQPPPPTKLPKPSRGQIEITLRRLPRLPLKGVPHINGIGQRRDIVHPECTGLIPQPDLSHTRPNARHRLPVIWIKPALHTIPLPAGQLPAGQLPAGQSIPAPRRTSSARPADRPKRCLQSRLASYAPTPK